MMILPAKVMAYPQVEMQACMAAAMNAVVVKTFSANMNDLNAYCDCALRKIIDEGKDIRLSISTCELRHLKY